MVIFAEAWRLFPFIYSCRIRCKRCYVHFPVAMTYFQAVKKSQLHKIIPHVEMFAAEVSFKEIKCPEFIDMLLVYGNKFTINIERGFLIGFYPF
ncbi:MAG: hypothetical protein DRH24_14460 [Deltaproteobacteria bacterium]|nr:MAG: hypothetical protein DRH24_14460 [Deltaproteobacteria bacterium]